MEVVIIRNDKKSEESEIIEEFPQVCPRLQVVESVVSDLHEDEIVIIDGILEILNGQKT